MSIDPIRAAIVIALLAVLAFIGWRIHAYGEARYAAGQANVQAKWDKDKARQQKELERLRTAAAKVTVRTEIQYIDRVKVVKEKGDAIVREIPVFVPAGSGELGGGFRLLHDAAADGGPVPDAAGIAHAAPVPAQDLAATVLVNYTAAHETAARLTALQDWVYEQCRLNPPPEGCVAPR